jgi:hypothetical protein
VHVFGLMHSCAIFDLAEIFVGSLNLYPFNFWFSSIKVYTHGLVIIQISGVRDSAAFRDLNTLGVENNIEEDKNPRQVTF